MKDNFEIKIESYHIADRGNSENVHQLPPEKLKCREVVHIDIAKVFIFALQQCRLWSFQAGGTKLERYLHKNQHKYPKEIIEFSVLD